MSIPISSVDPDSPRNDFDVAFGPGPLGITLETDYYKRYAVIKSIARGSLAASNPRLKAGLVLIGVNGEQLDGIGFNETMSLLKHALQDRLDDNPILLTFRRSSIHYKNVALPNNRFSLQRLHLAEKNAYHTSVMTDLSTKLRDYEAEIHKLESVLQEERETTESIIRSLRSQLRAERLSTQRSNEKETDLVNERPKMTPKKKISSTRLLSTVVSLRRVAIFFICFVLLIKLTENSVVSFYFPDRSLMDIWLSVAICLGLLYAHVQLALACLSEEISKCGIFLFVSLLFAMVEGHGILLTTSVFGNAIPQDHSEYQNPTPMTELNDKEMSFYGLWSYTTNRMTLFLFVVFIDHFSNYLFYGAHVALLYFSVVQESKYTSNTDAKLTWDLEYPICILHSFSLAMISIDAKVIPITCGFSLLVLKHQFIHRVKGSLALAYSARMAFIMIAIFVCRFLISVFFFQ